MSTAAKAEPIRTLARHTSPLDPIWDAVAEVADRNSLAECSIDYRNGGGTGHMDVVIRGERHRITVERA